GLSDHGRDDLWGLGPFEKVFPPQLGVHGPAGITQPIGAQKPDPDPGVGHWDWKLFDGDPVLQQGHVAVKSLLWGYRPKRQYGPDGCATGPNGCRFKDHCLPWPTGDR